MSVTFKQLEAFFHSAKLGSFSAAATKLHTTQSAVSKRVAELEVTLGVTLLHRASGGLEMAEAGRRLLPLVEESQRLLLRIATEVGSAQELRGTFRVGVTELVAITWLAPLMRKLQKLHPQLTLEPVVDMGLTLLEALKLNKIDLAIIPGTFWGGQYVTVKVGVVEDPWVASPKLNLPRCMLKPHEFAQFPVLEQSSDASKNKYYEAWRVEHGFKFGKVLSTNGISVLRELAIEGFGVCQLALDYVKPDIDAGLLRIVECDPSPPPLIYSAVYREDNVSPALERIVELSIESCDFSRPDHSMSGAPLDRISIDIGAPRD